VVALKAMVEESNGKGGLSELNWDTFRGGNDLVGSLQSMASTGRFHAPSMRKAVPFLELFLRHAAADAPPPPRPASARRGRWTRSWRRIVERCDLERYLSNETLS
jgi:hypothetical protein